MAVQPQKRARVPGGLAKVEQSLSELLIADTESNVMKLLRILQKHITAIDLKPFCEKVYHSADIRSHANPESPMYIVVCGSDAVVRQRVITSLKDTKIIPVDDCVLLTEQALGEKKDLQNHHQLLWNFTKEFALKSSHNIVISNNQRLEPSELDKAKEQGYRVAVFLAMGKDEEKDHKSLADLCRKSTAKENFIVDLTAWIDASDDRAKVSRITTNYSKAGDHWKQAIERVIQHESSLKLYVVSTKFNSVQYDLSVQERSTGSVVMRGQLGWQSRKDDAIKVLACSFDARNIKEFGVEPIEVEKDIQSIESAFENSKNFKIERVIESESLKNSLDRVKPFILYIACHGLGEKFNQALALPNGIVAFTDFVRNLWDSSIANGGNLQIVVLNCCYGEILAKELLKRLRIPHVIYWNGTCLDRVCPILAEIFFNRFATLWSNLNSEKNSLQYCVRHAFKESKEYIENQEGETEDGTKYKLYKFGYRMESKDDGIEFVKEKNGEKHYRKVDPDLPKDQWARIAGKLEHRESRFSIAPAIPVELKITKKNGNMPIGAFTLSPMAPLSLLAAAGETAKIPQEAYYYAYCHRPAPELREHLSSLLNLQGTENCESTLQNFAQFGGYIYFGMNKDPIQLNVLSKKHPSGDLDVGELFFSAAQHATVNVIEELDSNQRFEFADDKKRFKMCWVNQTEVVVPGGPSTEYGAFIYVDTVTKEGRIFAVCASINA